MSNYTVPDIPGLLSVLECQVLDTYARTSGVTRALEVGHYHGKSTAILLHALPRDCSLVTIDHHKGDNWATPTESDEFLKNIRPYVGDRQVVPIFKEMIEALAGLTRGFDFVFYDADHTTESVEKFWAVCEPLLSEHCLLMYDDGDWEDQAVLRELAEADGFTCVRTFPFARREGDKNNEDTYTLEIMQR
jgi:predicted O-methyltransferase YrrM